MNKYQGVQQYIEFPRNATITLIERKLYFFFGLEHYEELLNMLENVVSDIHGPLGI